MATATITWVPVNGSNYEIWYAKLSVVGSVNLPPSAGWVQATGSPFDSSLGTATITGLDDNTQYRFASRNDCSPSDSPWQTIIKYKLVCPTFSVVANTVGATDVGASISITVNLLNYVEYGAIANTTLTIKKTSDSTIADAKEFFGPYDSSTLTYTSSGLLVGTGYTVYLTIHDSIVATGDTTCTNQSITTQVPTSTPPPVCGTPTFTLGGLTYNSLQVFITNGLTGDTYDVSVDGGASYVILGVDGSTPITVIGLNSGTSYQVVVRRNCIAGGQSVSTSQTTTIPIPTIVGTMSIIRTTPFSTNNSEFGKLAFTFTQPTPAPLTILFGYQWEHRCPACSGGNCIWSAGYDIFPAVNTCPPPAQLGDEQGGAAHYPYIINIPAGVTTYTAINFITQAGGPGTYTPEGIYIGHYWETISGNIGGGSARNYTDAYLRISSPAGYTANFTYSDADTVIKGVNLHNV